MDFLEAPTAVFNSRQIQAALSQGDYPTRPPPTFYKALKYTNFGVMGRLASSSVSRYRSSRHYARRVKPPFFDDPDDGPFRVWRQVNKSKMLRNSVYQMDDVLGDRASVMWDQERLEALGMLEHKPR
ncbi:hypothetical protein F4776DRAFT_667386 [Hypoxylon sp. NC0597]|nr:hypothetical protein F4776DRAFT_667386 [Hypoxylon sp. NC0597]